MVQAQPKANSLWDYLKNTQHKKGWHSDSSGRMFAQQAWGLEFTSQYHHQQKKPIEIK
jgi:hypothetical protein